MSVGWPEIQLIQRKQNGGLIFPLNTEPTFKYTNNQRPPRKFNSEKSFYFTFHFFLSQKKKRLKTHTPSRSFQSLRFYTKRLVCMIPNVDLKSDVSNFLLYQNSLSISRICYAVTELNAMFFRRYQGEVSHTQDSKNPSHIFLLHTVKWTLLSSLSPGPVSCDQAVKAPYTTHTRIELKPPWDGELELSYVLWFKYNYAAFIWL